MLVAMCESWTAPISELSEGHNSRIANLSRELAPEKSLMVYQWVSEFIYVCTVLERNLNVSGVMVTAEPWLERVQRGEPVPFSIQRAVSNLQKAWVRLFAEVEPAAHEWVVSQLQRPEVIAFSERERNLSGDRLAGEDNLRYLDEYRQQRKQREPGVQGTRVETAG